MIDTSLMQWLATRAAGGHSAALVLAFGVAGCGGSGAGCLNEPRFTAELRIAVPGGGRVLGYIGDDSTPALSCPGSECFATVELGREIRLEASASEGRAFTGWSDGVGDDCGGAGVECRFEMEVDTRITASFGPPTAAWSSSYGGEEAENLLVGLVPRADGLVVVSGTLTDGDVFVASVDGSGTTGWSSWIGPARPRSAAAAFDGTLVGGGLFGQTRVGGIEVPSFGGQDGFLVHVDDGGSVSWARALGGPGHESIVAVAGDAAGAFAVGTYTEVFAANAQIAPSPDGRDLFVGALDNEGTVRAMTALGSPGDETVIALARAQDSTLWLLAHSDGVLQWDGGSLEGSGFALLHLSGTDASVLESERLGGQVQLDDYSAGALLAGDRGDLYVAITFVGTITLGETSYQSVGPSDFVVARRAATGEYAWARQLGGVFEVEATGLAAAGEHLVVVGGFSGLATFGGAETHRAETHDAFAVLLDRTSGTTVAALNYGAPNQYSGVRAVAAIGERDFAIGGSTDGPIDFGRGPMYGGFRTAFVARFDN